MPPAPRRRARLPLAARCVALGGVVPARGDGALAEWLRSAVIPVPPTSLNVSALGVFVKVDGGNCTDLEVESLQATDLGNAGSPEVGYQLSGVSLQCTIDLQGAGRAVTARVRLGSSAVRLHLLMERQGTEMPFRRVLVTDCSFDAQITDLDFTGSSVLATFLHGASGVIHSFFEHSSKVMCSILSTFIKERSEVALGEAFGAFRSAAAEAADADAQAAAAQSRQPSPATPLLDWRTWPPIVVTQALLSDRSDIVAKLVRDASPLEFPLGGLLAGGDLPAVEAALVGRSILVDGLETLLEGGGLRFGGQGSVLNASVAFRRVSATVALEAQVNVTSGKAQGSLRDTSSSLRDMFNLTVEAQDGSAALAALAMVSLPALRGLGVDQLQDPRCLGDSAAGAAEPPASPVWLQTLTGNATIGLKFEAQGRLERDIADALETTAGALACGGGSEALGMLARDGLNVARARGNKAIAEFSRAPGTCPASNVYQGLPPATALAFACAAFSAAAIGCNFALATAARRRPPAVARGLRHQGLNDYIGAGETSKYARAAPAPMYPLQVDASAAARHLGDSWVVPRAVTMLYPTVAVAGLTLYLYADLSLAIVVDFVFQAGAAEFRVSPTLAFSVAICAADAWGAGAYAIALCIVLLSILGPFVKIVFLMFAWLVPPSRLEPEVRGRVLSLLDEYGKYSLVDSWLGILSLASYRRLSWHSTSVDASFVVDPVPMLPFFAFFAATVLSLGLGHVAYGYHRRLEEEELELELELLGAPRERRRAGPRSLRAYSPILEACGLTVALFATAAVIIVGAAVDSFQMIASGVLVQVLLDPPATVQVYSLLELGAGIPFGSEQDVGLRMVQVIFFLFALLVPLLEMAALLGAWLLPMPSKAQKASINFCHALGAWAALDVFVLAVVISYFEFGLFSTFLVYEGSIGKTCRALRDVFHMDCFHMECALASGFPALLVAGLASFATPKVALAVCTRALERKLREEESPDEDTAMGLDPSDSDGLVSSDGSPVGSCWQLWAQGDSD